MAKVKFGTSVKFKGKFIPANQPFTVSDAEFVELINGGAVAVEAPATIEKVVETPQPVEKPKKAPAKKATASAKK